MIIYTTHPVSGKFNRYLPIIDIFLHIFLVFIYILIVCPNSINRYPSDITSYFKDLFQNTYGMIIAFIECNLLILKTDEN